jgi:hypothetical protein
MFLNNRLALSLLLFVKLLILWIISRLTLMLLLFKDWVDLGLFKQGIAYILVLRIIPIIFSLRIPHISGGWIAPARLETFITRIAFFMLN